jgi:hypothetical protein
VACGLALPPGSGDDALMDGSSLEKPSGPTHVADRFAVAAIAWRGPRGPVLRGRDAVDDSGRTVALEWIAGASVGARVAVVRAVARVRALRHRVLATPDLVLSLPTDRGADLVLVWPWLPRTAEARADAIPVVREALRVAHDAGLVHGALGWDEVRLDARGNVVLTGLGLAAALSWPAVSLNPRGGSASLHPRADLHALAAMAAGRGAGPGRRLVVGVQLPVVGPGIGVDGPGLAGALVHELRSGGLDAHVDVRLQPEPGGADDSDVDAVIGARAAAGDGGCVLTAWVTARPSGWVPWMGSFPLRAALPRELSAAAAGVAWALGCPWSGGRRGRPVAWEAGRGAGRSPGEGGLAHP